MTVITINPLTDSRYDTFVSGHPDATIFHTSTWMRVLHETYGFKPECVAAEENGGLTAVLPFMETRSITAKKKAVALPFSDFCAPLANSKEAFKSLSAVLTDTAARRRWQYIDMRGGTLLVDDAPAGETILTHDIDLTANEQTLFKRLRSNMQRNIRKAEQQGLTVSFSNDTASLGAFYRLNCLTRKAHGIPPQPWKFFRLLHKYILVKTRGFVASVHFNDRVIASALFLFFNDKAYYKYGASDRSYLAMRPNDMMMWECIRYCKKQEIHIVNLGRTELHHTGLLQFKRGLNGVEREWNYYRYSIRQKRFITIPRKNGRGIVPVLFSRMPVGVLKVVGRVLYRFAG